MKSLLFIFITMIASVLSSCDPCSNLDCVSSNYDGQFRIVSAATGNDLVFGPNRIYDAGKIRFYSLKGIDTTFLEYQPIKFGNGTYDSILTVRFYPETNMAFIKLGNGDIDTLEVSYSIRDTKCCGGITTITKFRYNNTVDLPGQGTQELKK